MRETQREELTGNEIVERQQMMIYMKDYSNRTSMKDSRSEQQLTSIFDRDEREMKREKKEKMPVKISNKSKRLVISYIRYLSLSHY